MEFLGIGIPELLLIAVLTLIVVGPDRLPEVMVKVARFIREFREFASNMTTEFTTAIEEMEEEFKDVTEATHESLRTVQTEVNAVGQAASLDGTAAEPAPAGPGEGETAEVEPATAAPSGRDPAACAPLQQRRCHQWRRDGDGPWGQRRP
jgi:Tat protein translocase TatB subunit